MTVLPAIPTSTAVFALVFLEIFLISTGWLLYFVIKSAVRDGIKEATLPDGYELVMQRIDADKTSTKH